MANTHTFTAPILPARGGGAYIEVPIDVEAIFGKKRVPVSATIDGIAYRGTVLRMGSPEFVLGVLKEIRIALAKEIGDTVTVTIEEDLASRAVNALARGRKFGERE